jgi:hypothetical protein
VPTVLRPDQAIERPCVRALNRLHGEDVASVGYGA